MNAGDRPTHPLFAVPSFEYRDEGMTLRQWLAGIALAGLCSRPQAHRDSQHDANMLASQAVMYADALLERLAPPATTAMERDGCNEEVFRGG